ncbi:catalase-related domain-containing protein [Rahnella sp. PCH160]|uniref:catalase-related domain-containing protein n=1 Tax=Rahnella sp. PCH160 TaxID=3447928 RepID=UPI0039FBFE70
MTKKGLTTAAGAPVAGELKHASPETQKRQLDLFYRVDPAYGAGVEQALKA